MPGLNRETLTGLLDLAQAAFTGNDSGDAPVLLMLGQFKFSLNTAVFLEMVRSAEYNWPTVPRFGKLDAVQYTGPGAERITLPGVLYPDWRGHWRSIDNLRGLASLGKPQRLIANDGTIIGLFVVESVEERASIFKADGWPRRQEFTVTIRRASYGADLS